eukprot:TRINITY_DN9406_c2_g1_i1.p1 TRINITY_DN9406_c2_g1~~TRINITY_DN9406_c2_g1_i1.p1  ORF type:complete len:539 (-),score=65.66 TRINITY_DN9406_c2_g1_i1:38-1654(-)
MHQHQRVLFTLIALFGLIFILSHNTSHTLVKVNDELIETDLDVHHLFAGEKFFYVNEEGEQDDTQGNEQGWVFPRQTLRKFSVRKNGLKPDRESSSYGHYRWKVVGRKGAVLYRYPVPAGYWTKHDQQTYKSSYEAFLAAEADALQRAQYFAKNFNLLNLSSDEVPKVSSNPYLLYSVHDTFIGQEELEPRWRWVKNISIVYTWVNGSEPEHLAMKQHVLNISQVDSRDRNNDELKYSIRGLEQALPWHKGTIYLVSPRGHIPSWMNTKHPRIKIIDQNSIVPPEFHPTFNTNCIEAWLHLIPNITNRFIYMNDEFFMYGAYIHPSAFFNTDKFTRLYQTHYTMFAGCQDHVGVRQQSESRFRLKACKWMNGTYNIIRQAGLHAGYLMDERFGLRFRYYPRHAPYVFCRQVLRNLHRVFPTAYQATCQHKTRDGTDVSTTFMHHQYQIERYERYLVGKNPRFDGIGYCIPSLRESVREAPLIMLRNNKTLNMLLYRRILFDTQPLFFTLNDDYNLTKVAAQMKYFLSHLYPKKSFAEK